MDNSTARPGDQRQEVLQLCSPVRQSIELLAVEGPYSDDLEHRLVVTEALAHDRTSSDTDLIDSVKSVRYFLLETAQGPPRTILADTAAMIVGDGHGRLFF